MTMSSLVELGALPLFELRAEIQRRLRSEREKVEERKRAVIAVTHPRSPRPVKVGRVTHTTQKASRLRKAFYDDLAARGMKHCSRCGADKPLAEFWRSGYCIPCGRAYDKMAQHNRLHEKFCRACRQTKMSDQFPSGAGTYSCNECRATDRTRRMSRAEKLRRQAVKLLDKLDRVNAELSAIEEAA